MLSGGDISAFQIKWKAINGTLKRQIVCDRHKMQGKRFNESQKVADEKTSLIKMDQSRPIFISNVAFVSVHVTVPTILRIRYLCEEKFT